LLIGLVIVDEGLELLTEEQARGLLATGEVGRVGVTLGALPAIFPVNCRLIDGSIVFRTAPGSKMSAAAEGAVVAFEVDDYQLADRSGWSVLAVGRAEVINDLATSPRCSTPESNRWPRGGGRRSCGSSRRLSLVDASSTTRLRLEPEPVSGQPPFSAGCG
jgi:nitroimidazol reductase NimA-like FMN-containing flavoprotein (pyridoxamine 5'-phosphate oxidase superfamily)